ncbi:RagB/SusD family nutrient uptake outer membrane protein [Rufibacter roseus]|uniref:RagB/SusD family nutrient uptake outer membrane protein n=1 Tax=Rufibacter roseus TaxID=1567108 RepID=A0ABW2DMX0_9BACT|nr:RagB/SusD family nutrient uptake outer membrane protein [Rufibacter roseus]
MKRIFIIASLLFSTLFVSSCEDYLDDVSKELAEERTMESIFSNPSEVRRFHRSIYNAIPNTGNFWFNTANGQDNPWTWMSDEIEFRNVVELNTFAYNAGEDRFSRWGFYREIRQANLFLEYAREIPQNGTVVEFLDAAEVKDLKAQARFFRAYYHYLLFELYGPIPIMDKIADPKEPNIDYPRNSVDEVVDFIYNELTAVADELKNPDLSDQTLLAVPTKGTALAVRAKLMVYAASPLYNGGYAEAMALKNPDGKQLFPAYSANKWNRALTAIQEFIDYANQGHYSLYKAYTNGQYDPDKSVYEVFQSYNEEVIFARSDVGDTWGSVSNSAKVGIDARSLPRGTLGGTSQTGVIGLVQEYVDDYFMMDGLPIEESPLYQEEGFSAPGEDLTGQNGAGISKMYINREPRFYNSVFYNGRRWHVGNQQIWFHDGGNSDRGNNIDIRTGYINYKRLNRRVYNSGTNPRSVYRPAIIFRLAEFYLLYAEVLNEVNPTDPRIIEYVDKVRERAGIPKLADIKPGIIGNQNLQREAIRREMRVELATEGQRYFNVRRWMIAENEPGEGGQGGLFHAMNLDGNTKEEFQVRTPLENRVFERRMYLYPIPMREVQNSPAIIQNPGY